MDAQAPLMNNETDHEVEVDQNDVIQIAPEEENTRPTPVISVAEIRPFPAVSQTTPQVRRSQKQKNRLGRTRILTDTRLILEDRQRQLEKIVKVGKRLQTIHRNRRKLQRLLQRRKRMLATLIQIVRLWRRLHVARLKRMQRKRKKKLKKSKKTLNPKMKIPRMLL